MSAFGLAGAYTPFNREMAGVNEQVLRDRCGAEAIYRPGPGDEMLGGDKR